MKRHKRFSLRKSLFSLETATTNDRFHPNKNLKLGNVTNSICIYKKYYKKIRFEHFKDYFKKLQCTISNNLARHRNRVLRFDDRSIEILCFPLAIRKGKVVFPFYLSSRA